MIRFVVHVVPSPSIDSWRRLFLIKCKFYNVTPFIRIDVLFVELAATAIILRGTHFILTCVESAA